jgi:hypothetical protein
MQGRLSHLLALGGEKRGGCGVLEIGAKKIDYLPTINLVNLKI